MIEINKVDEFRLDTLIDQWNLKEPINNNTSDQATDYRKPRGARLGHLIEETPNSDRSWESNHRPASNSYSCPCRPSERKPYRHQKWPRWLDPHRREHSIDIANPA